MKPLFSQHQITSAVKRVSDVIRSHYSDCLRIAIMDGGYFFARDIERHVLGEEHTRIGWIRCKSYTKEEVGAPSVTHLPHAWEVQGKVILLIDDVIETSSTMYECRNRLIGLGAKAVMGCALVSKTDRLPPFVPESLVPLRANKDDWLVGYGMDLDGEYRGLPFITTKEEIREC